MMRTGFWILLLGLKITLYGQEVYQLHTLDSAVRLKEIAGISLYNAFGTSPSPITGGVNAYNGQRGQDEFLMFSFKDPDDVTEGKILFHKDGQLHIRKIVHLGIEDLLLLGSYKKEGVGEFMALGMVSLKLNSIRYFKLLSLGSDPSFALKPVDMLVSRNLIYVLAEAHIPYLSEIKNKIVLLKIDGNTLLWSHIYNGVAPIHSETPQALSFSPDGDILVSGIVKRAGDSLSQMMLGMLSPDGEPLLLKSVSLKTPVNLDRYDYGWTTVKSKGLNIHLFSQPTPQKGNLAPLLVTMFDNQLALRTWRNYDVPVRSNSNIVDGNFFMFGGSAPDRQGKEGYALMKVNASNAIVEKLRIYDSSIQLDPMNTASGHVYDRWTDKLWTLLNSTHSGESSVHLISNPSSLEHKCASDAIATVAKDPIDLENLPFSGKELDLQLSDLDIFIEPVRLRVKELCTVTGTKEEVQTHVDLTPNPVVGNWSIEAQQIMDGISIHSVSGSLILSLKVNNYRVDMSGAMPPGLYLCRIRFKDGSSTIVKIQFN